MSKRQTKSVPSKGPSDALKQCVTLCNGVAIPKLGLGTHLMDPDECERAVKAALKQGYRLIDTAAMYSNERGVGKAIRDSNVPRHEVFVSTKLQPCDMGYEGTLAAFHRSLAMLELDYLDLYLIHWPNEDVGRRLGSWKAMEELYAQGKVRAIGVSNYMVRHLQEIMDSNSFQVIPMVNQCEFHPQCQFRTLRPYCARHKIAFMGFMPFGGQGAPILKHNRTVQRIAQAIGRTEAQVMLRWILDHDVIAIPKTRSAERLKENADLSFLLPSEFVTALDALDTDATDWDPTRTCGKETSAKDTETDVRGRPPPLPTGSPAQRSAAVPPAATPPPAPASSSDNVRPLPPPDSADAPAFSCPSEIAGGGRAQTCPLAPLSEATHAALQSITETVMAITRAPGDGGCPWFSAVSPGEVVQFTRSELAEVEAEMIAMNCAGGDAQRAVVGRRLEEEIGDLLFDVLMLACSCGRDGLPVSLAAAATAAAEKFQRRCPHVFGGAHATSRREAEALWLEEKAKEQAGPVPLPTAKPGVKVVPIPSVSQATSPMHTATPEAGTNAVTPSCRRTSADEVVVLGPYDLWPVAVAETKSHEKRLVADVELMVGDTAYSNTAWAWVVEDALMDKVCAHCFKTFPEELPLHCEDCLIVSYCSEACQTAATLIHTYECESLQQVIFRTQGRTNTTGARLLIRVLAQRLAEAEGHWKSPEGSLWEDVQLLSSNLNRMDKDQHDRMRGIARGISQLDVGQGLREDHLVHLVAQIYCHQLKAVAPTQVHFGYALMCPMDVAYSETPNLQMQFEGTTVAFKCVKDIQPGEQLSIPLK